MDLMDAQVSGPAAGSARAGVPARPQRGRAEGTPPRMGGCRSNGAGVCARRVRGSRHRGSVQRPSKQRLFASREPGGTSRQ